MRKALKDSKTLLFENMAKLNSGFKVNEAEDKWIQKAVNPEHKGYCTPMTKPTCTPARKALAKRFKKGIDEELGSPAIQADTDEATIFNEKKEQIKQVIDRLYQDEDYEVIQTLYRLIVDKKSTLREGEDYRRKVELLKGKIDFLYNTKHFDIIDNVDNIITKLFPSSEPETEIAEATSSDTYFPTLSAALDKVRENVEKRGFTVDEDAIFNQFGTGGVNYGETKRANIPLLKDGRPSRRNVTIAIYRMDSGTYELTAYIN